LINAVQAKERVRRWARVYPIWIDEAQEVEELITQQEEQIEKMKCCENCKHGYWSQDSIECDKAPNVEDYPMTDEGGVAYNEAYQKTCQCRDDFSDWEFDE
jgi:hypothetical protein